LAGHLLLHFYNAGHLTQINLKVEDDPIARKKRRNWHEYFLHHWCHCCGAFHSRLFRISVAPAPVRSARSRRFWGS